MKNKSVLTFSIMKYLIWPLICIIAIIIVTVLGSLHPEHIVTYGIVAAVINLLLFAVIIYFAKKRILTETLNLSFQISKIQEEHLLNFDLPYCVINQKGEIKWFNHMFYDMLNEQTIINKKITKFFEQIDIEKLPDIQKPYDLKIEFENKFYQIRVSKNALASDAANVYKNSDKIPFYGVYFYDITRETQLDKLNNDQKGIVGFIYIDNYDEVLQSTEDVRRPLLIALIDRNVNKFAKSVEGVIRKLEKDKYVFFIQKKHMDTLTENKFSILDDIRNINIGNDLPVTISVGLGVHDESYVKSAEFARIAIDLAMGRGGDQAVIKNNDKLVFYGGKTRGVETSARVKARIKSYAFKELLVECDNVIIVGHKNPDLDSLGAAMGIYACARILDKEAHIVLNNVSTAVRSLYDKIIESDSFPEDIFLSSSQGIEYTRENTAVVVVDVNRPSFLECPELLNYSNKIVVFDHHRVSAEQVENTVLRYVEPYASSTCEMVTEILRYIEDNIKLDPLEADALFAGISVDTKNFVVKTGVKTFEAAAFLRRNGADVIRVRHLFKNDMETYKARASAVRDATIYRDKMAITVCPSLINNPTLAAAQAADELLNISGILASFVLTEVEGTIYISARSFDDINVQLIMEKLGGGGHLSVAGAQLEDRNIADAIHILKEKIDEYIEEGVEE